MKGCKGCIFRYDDLKWMCKKEKSDSKCIPEAYCKMVKAYLELLSFFNSGKAEEKQVKTKLVGV